VRLDLAEAEVELVARLCEAATAAATSAEERALAARVDRYLRRRLARERRERAARG